MSLVDDAEAIVRALALSPPVIAEQDCDACPICLANTLHTADVMAHEPWCLVTKARAWVRRADAERGGK